MSISAVYKDTIYVAPCTNCHGSTRWAGTDINFDPIPNCYYCGRPLNHREVEKHGLVSPPTLKELNHPGGM